MVRSINPFEGQGKIGGTGTSVSRRYYVGIASVLATVLALPLAAQDADAIITAAAKISRKVMAALPRLKVVVRYGVGYDTIEVPAGIYRLTIPTDDQGTERDFEGDLERTRADYEAFRTAHPGKEHWVKWRLQLLDWIMESADKEVK